MHSEIKSNLQRSAVSYDEEMEASQSYANPPEFQPDEKVVDLEEAIGIREEHNYAAAASRRWKEQKHFMGKENEAMRLVNIKSPHRVFRQLQRAGVDARIEAPHFYVWMADDVSGRLISLKRERSVGRLWLHDDAVAGRVGVSAWVIDNGVRVRKLVTTLQYPYGPEWSLMHFDAFDVPQSEKYRGWRTAMLQLILAGVLTEAEVDRAFGPVPLGPVSLLYRQYLYSHRQRRAGLIQ
jgi:hypothetical protein